MKFSLSEYIQKARKEEAKKMESREHRLKPVREPRFVSSKRASENCAIEIKNFPPEWTSNDIIAQLGPYGKISKCSISGGNKSGTPLIATVNFENPKYVKTVIEEVHNKTIGSYTLYIQPKPGKILQRKILKGKPFRKMTKEESKVEVKKHKQADPESQKVAK